MTKIDILSWELRTFCHINDNIYVNKLKQGEKKNMICKECGNNVPDGQEYCPSCGTKLEAVNNNVVYTNVQPNVVYANDTSSNNSKPKKNKKTVIIIVAAILVVIGIIYGVVGGGDISTIKNGKLYNHTEKTVGDAFSDFFSDRSWKSVDRNGETYVIFTGDCTNLETGKQEEMEIEFQIDGDSFEITKIKFGGETYTNAVDIAVLLNTIYAG